MAVNKPKMLGARVSEEVHAQFTDWAKSRGGVSAALERFVVDTLAKEGQIIVADTPEPASLAEVKFRLREDERAELARMAWERGIRPALFVRSLVVATIMRRPVFSDNEADALRAIAGAVRAFARKLSVMAWPSRSAAADALRDEVLTLIAKMVSGNASYWGVNHGPGSGNGLTASEVDDADDSPHCLVPDDRIKSSRSDHPYGA